MHYNLEPVAGAISKYVDSYKELLLGKSKKQYNELYKWRAAKIFKEHWNPDAEKMSDMLEKCFTPSTNLTVGQNYFPVRMIREFSEMNNEKVRSTLKYLMDESFELEVRFSHIKKQFDELLIQYNRENNENNNRHYIGDRFLAVLLYFINPDKYYLYKFSMFRDFCELFSLPLPKRGDDNNYRYFCTLCDKIREILTADRELIQISKSLLDESCYEDNSLHLLVQDFVYACTTYLSDESKGNDEDPVMSGGSPLVISESNPSYKKKEDVRYWLLAPGVGAQMWEDFYAKGIAAIGWEEMGNLKMYSSRDEMAEMLRKKYSGNKGNQRHNSLALWNFSREIKKGDIVVVKKGTTDYLGYGIVIGDYQYEPSNSSFPNQLKVDWKKKGVWAETDGPIVTKILTDITKYPAYVEKLKQLLGIVEKNSDNKKVQHWWLNASPRYWKITDFEIGQEQSYTTYNENGNKRRIYEYFKDLQIGDQVIGYESSPTLKVIALMEVTEGIHVDDDDGQEKISFVLSRFFPNPVSWTDLPKIKELENCEPLKSNQGSLFKLTPHEFEAIVKASSGVEIGMTEQYSMDIASGEIFIEKEKLNTILRLLEKKKNILLQGPPGVGKTFLAKRLAYLWMEEKDPDKIEMVQFHQSYSYEDFMQGYRPTEDGKFKLVNGVFYRFCKKAMRNPNEDYFFIIDEINRGNLSKIFGELMMLMESDKRGEQFSIPLTYSSDNVSHFYIPNNLYIIGTMNTADRSLAVVDYALRRRFAFIELTPSFDELFVKYLKNNKISAVIINRILDRFKYLNSVIEDDRNLGKGFLLGHSYFCYGSADGDFEKWYNDIIEFEIAPILREYWFDDSSKANDQIERLY